MPHLERLITCLKQVILIRIRKIILKTNWAIISQKPKASKTSVQIQVVQNVLHKYA